MALFDLLSTDMYNSYNCVLARTLGLHAAIYLSELININRKAIEKQKLVQDFFTVDRKYVEQRTTLSKQEQLSLDQDLAKLGIISIGESVNALQVHTDTLTGIMLNDTEQLPSKVLIKESKDKLSKKELILENLKANIYTKNTELQGAYSSWVSTIYNKQGWMSKKSVLMAQQTVDQYAKGDLDLALMIISLADSNGYRDMTWAINLFEKNYKKEFQRRFNSTPVVNSNPVMSTEVF